MPTTTAIIKIYSTIPCPLWFFNHLKLNIDASFLIFLGKIPYAVRTLKQRQVVLYNRLTMKNNIKIIITASLTAFLFVFIAIAFFFYGQRQKDFKDSSLRYAQNTAVFSAASINEALNASDDIKLFSILEALSKSENIAASFIAGPDAKIIMHSDISLVSKSLSEPVYKEALSKNEPLLQKTGNSFLFSVPLAHSAVLFVQILPQDSLLGNWKTAYLLFAILLSLAFAAGLFFALKKMILLPFEKTKSDIQSGSINAQNAQVGDEISDILIKERKKSQKSLNLLKANEDSLTALIEHFCNSQKDKSQAIIVLNSLNNIVFAYDGTAKILKSGFNVGQNILEAAAHPELLSLISKSNDKPGKEIEAEIAGFRVLAFSLSKGGEVLAAIIKTVG